MGDESGLGRLVVEGDDDHEGVDGCLCAEEADLFDGLSGVVGADPADDAGA